MRTDVKIGIAVGLVLVVGFVAYMVINPGSPETPDGGQPVGLHTTPDPGGTDAAGGGLDSGGGDTTAAGTGGTGTTGGGEATASPLHLTVPRTAQPPTLDGVLAPGEWDDAAATTGLLSQFGQVAHPRQATFWLKYDAANLYVACRSTVFPEEQNSVSPQTMFDRDSSIVVGIDPARIGRGTSPSHFLLRANLTKQLRGREVFWSIEGGKQYQLPDVKLTVPQPGWTSGATVEQTITKGVWVWEMSLPLKNLKAADAKDGEEWGLLLARDYSAGDQNALTLSSDWRFGDGNRHNGLAFYNHYRFEKEYARMKLGGRAPAVQLLNLGDVAGGKPAPVVAVKNTTGAPVSVVVRCEYRIAYGLKNHDAKQ